LSRALVIEQSDTSPGFFGKVISHGDFVARRVPPAFRHVWDAWLQQGLHASREQLGQSWLAAYLTSPIWRFATAQGVCGPNAWAGVMIPSVDRVGRHFPLTLVASAGGEGSIFSWIGQGKAWFNQLEALALSTLDQGFSLDVFDAALHALAPLPPLINQDEGALPLHMTDVRGACRPIQNMEQVAVLATKRSLLTHHSLWWTEGSSKVQPCLLTCQHLPRPISFAAMIDGDWGRHGWQIDAP